VHWTHRLLLVFFVAALLPGLPGCGSASPSGSAPPSLAAGYLDSCALARGAVQCWGWNRYGQLGNRSNVDSHTPVPVEGLTTGGRSIAAGHLHFCAVVNQVVQCWGYIGADSQGQNLLTNVPLPIAGLTGSIPAIAAGYDSSCALDSGGVQCWGWNTYGQLGTDAITDAPTPVSVAVPVAGLASGVEAISSGGSHSCAIFDAGVWCWGRNDFGQLGDDSLTNRPVPVQVVGLTTRP